MINISNNRLQIILSNTNKALAKAIKSASPQELEVINKNRDLRSVLQSLLKENPEQTASNKTLLQLLKENPTLKNLGSLSSTIKELLNSLKSQKNPLPMEKTLKDFLIDIKEISETSLKNKIVNSGVFLESKLKNAQNPQQIKDIISNDLKSILLRANEEVVNSSLPNKTEILKHIDKLSTQIDYYQLLSHLSNSSVLYLPLSWDALKEGNISLKKAQDDKFYCDIELTLEKYGDILLRLVVFEKNQINIVIDSQNNDFKNIIKENLSLLRSALTKANLSPREIRLLDTNKKTSSSQYEESGDSLKLGFEVKV